MDKGDSLGTIWYKNLEMNGVISVRFASSRRMRLPEATTVHDLIFFFV